MNGQTQLPSRYEIAAAAREAQSDLEFMSIKRAAEFAGCPVSTIRTAMKRGELPVRRFNAKVIVTTRRFLLQWLAEIDRRSNAARNAPNAR